MDDALLEAAERNSASWFKRPYSKAVLQGMLHSYVKSQTNGRVDCVQLKIALPGDPVSKKRPTKIDVITREFAFHDIST